MASAPHDLAPWTLGTRTFAWGDRTYVMGILNVTPDSFSDGGTHGTVEAALSHARRMLADGADLIDVGGESTRPGSLAVSAEEERERVVPVIRALRAETDAAISIDTCKAEVADAALSAGAHLVNDISGLEQPAMRRAIARHKAAGVAMHMQGTPRTMQQAPRYDDVVAEVRAYLGARLAQARSEGLDRVAVDPGIGFGKTLDQNLALLRHLPVFRMLGAPVLLGTSRKGFIGHLLDLPVDQRVEGTMATVALAVRDGVDIVRVHDVREAVRTVRVADAVVRGAKGGTLG
ncbi:MAG TPA: dihydropteroate synthase [Pantanalinema sp.]